MRPLISLASEAGLRRKMACYPQFLWITILAAAGLIVAPLSSAAGIASTTIEEEHAIASAAKSGGFTDTLIDGEPARVVHAGMHKGCAVIGVIYPNRRKIDSAMVCGTRITKSTEVPPTMPTDQQAQYIVDAVRSSAARTGAAIQRWQGYSISARRAFEGIHTDYCTAIETVVTYESNLVFHYVGDHCAKPTSVSAR